MRVAASKRKYHSWLRGKLGRRLVEVSMIKSLPQMNLEGVVEFGDPYFLDEQAVITYLS